MPLEQTNSHVASPKHTLIVLNPGHFHAALTLRRAHPRLNDDVYVYADPGPDLDAFVNIVQSFNQRVSEPTHWNLHVYCGRDHLERLLSERPGKVVIVAGTNDTKLDCIWRLHEAGFFVLGDKPWLIDPAKLPMLKAVAAAPPLAMDIMTERHEAANRVQKALMRRPELFGALRNDGGQPAIELKSVHHLYKTVNGRPLVRPVWYFDVGVQGEGITDVTTHLVDLVQWMMGGEPFDCERDAALSSARQWPTRVPLRLFSRITGLEVFPPTLCDAVEAGALSYLCNATISYSLRGVPVHIESVWALEIPDGGGDLHWCILRGEKADLIVDQSAATRFVPELFVHPSVSSARYTMALNEAVGALQDSFPGVAVEASTAGAFHIRIPDALRTTHEQHFAAVLDRFLALVDRQEQPGNLAPDLIAKYSLLAQAARLAHSPA